MWNDQLFFQLYAIWVMVFLGLTTWAIINKKSTPSIYLWVWLGLGIIGKSLRYLYFKLGDVQVYKLHYEQIVNGLPLKWSSADFLYTFYTQLTALFQNVWIHFLGIELLIVLPIFLWCRKIFPKYAWWALAIFLAYPHFVAYSVNGIRFGIASSFFILATAYSKKDWRSYLLMITAVLFHVTLIIPILLWMLLLNYKKITWRMSMIIWACSSLIGIFFTQNVLNLITYLVPIEYSYRLHYYFVEELGGGITHYGAFRWKYWIFNLLIIIYLLLIKRANLFNLYGAKIAQLFVLTAGVTALFYGAYFSNRFGSLGWILIPVLFLLPVLNIPTKSHRKMGILLLTFGMILIQLRNFL